MKREMFIKEQVLLVFLPNFAQGFTYFVVFLGRRDCFSTLDLDDGSVRKYNK